MTVHPDLAARRSRLAAAWLVALVVTLVSATAHQVAGGAPPAPVALVASTLVSGFLGTAALTALRSDRLGRARLAALVALDQAIQHASFSFLGTGGSAVPADAPAAHATHGALGASAPAIAATGIPLDQSAGSGMLALHVAAAVVAYALLARGAAAVARALLALALTAARLLEAPRPAAAPASSRAPLGAIEQPALPAAVVLGGSGRRGPPAAALAR